MRRRFLLCFFLALFFRSTAIVAGILVAKTNRDVGFGPLTFSEDGRAHGSSDLSPARLAGLFYRQFCDAEGSTLIRDDQRKFTIVEGV
jgi:hypothetical protein